MLNGSMRSRCSNSKETNWRKVATSLIVALTISFFIKYGLFDNYEYPTIQSKSEITEYPLTNKVTIVTLKMYKNISALKNGENAPKHTKKVNDLKANDTFADTFVLLTTRSVQSVTHSNYELSTKYREILKPSKRKFSDPHTSRKNTTTPRKEINTTSGPSIAHTTSGPSIAHTTSRPSIVHTKSGPSIAHTTSRPSIAHTTSGPSIAHTTSRPSIAHTTSGPSIAHTTSGPSIAHTTSGPSIAHTTRQIFKYNATNVDQVVDKVLQNIHTQRVNCSQLFAGDASEQAKADVYNRTHKEEFMNFAQLAQNCTRFVQENLITHSITSQEYNFPLAYSIMVYRNPGMAFRLLRAIYRPHNYYCIHIDKKSPPSLHNSLKAIVQCLPNVFIASKLYNVTWGTMTVLQAEFACMEDLRHYSWEYFINLTGEEFPLLTNKKVVQFLWTLNGSNDITGYSDTHVKERWGGLVKELADNITLMKGSLHIAAQRGFVDYVLHSPVSTRFMRWVANTTVPDETFFNSLSHSPQLGVPGARAGENTRSYVRFKLWVEDNSTKMHYPCHGRRAHNLCVFGIRDLPLLHTRTELFVNKFHQDFEPLAYDCMEEWYFKNVLHESKQNLVHLTRFKNKNTEFERPRLKT